MTGDPTAEERASMPRVVHLEFDQPEPGPEPEPEREPDRERRSGA